MSTKKPRSFTFLTWNLSLLENSAEAPSHWRIDQTEAYVREFVLELSPDFVFFQELPGLVPYVETHDLVPENTISHSGNLATLAKHELMPSLESRVVGKQAILTSVNSAGISLANVHLEPGRSGAHARQTLMQHLVSECTTPGLVVAGDTNTRVDEETSLASIGLRGTRPPKPTWNSRTNLFRDQDRKYTAYYTRYFCNRNVVISHVKVWDQPISKDGKRFFVSDHFALSGRVMLS